jgi:hypothetical protein
MRGHLSGEVPVTISDTESDVDLDNEMIKLGVQIGATARLIGVLMVKEELGCEGVYNCGKCEEDHCGTLKYLNIQVVPGVNNSFL